MHTYEIFPQHLSNYSDEADDRLGNPPQGNQEPLMLKEMVERREVSLVLASPWNVFHFPSKALTRWLGDRDGICLVKKLAVGLLMAMI